MGTTMSTDWRLVLVQGTTIARIEPPPTPICEHRSARGAERESGIAVPRVAHPDTSQYQPVPATKPDLAARPQHPKLSNHLTG